jgi:acyl-[acyl-carrier-protein] desaturase
VNRQGADAVRDAPGIRDVAELPGPAQAGGLVGRSRARQAAGLLSRDETGHFEFFKNGVLLYMRMDRDLVLEKPNSVIRSFQMPAQSLIPNWSAQDQFIRKLGIFDDRIYMRDVVKPVLKALGIDGDEFREARRRLSSAA